MNGKDQGPFTARKVASSGHEVFDPNGNVIAWTVDGYWAAVIVALLNRLELGGFGDDSHIAATGGNVAPKHSVATSRQDAGHNR
jgi:hypothetical protein